jgi:hypothetical protein
MLAMKPTEGLESWQNAWKLGCYTQIYRLNSYHFPSLEHSNVSVWYEAINWNFEARFPTRWIRFQTELIV